MDLRDCDICKWKYPENLLNPLFTGSYTTEPICAICALQLTNRIHGTITQKFSSEIAEHMRQLALRWRKKNPQYKGK